MMLLPAAPGTCPICATMHAPEMPHNQHWERELRQLGRWNEPEDGQPSPIHRLSHFTNQ